MGDEATPAQTIPQSEGDVVASGENPNVENINEKLQVVDIEAKPNEEKDKEPAASDESGKPDEAEVKEGDKAEKEEGKSEEKAEEKAKD